jgi:hypothetical protein
MPLLARLRERAAADHRTLDGQVIWLLQESIQDPESASATPSCDRTAQLAAWHAFAGQWRGSPQETDAVIADIYDARTVGQEIEETGQASTAADRSLQGD